MSAAAGVSSGGAEAPEEVETMSMQRTCPAVALLLPAALAVSVAAVAVDFSPIGFDAACEQAADGGKLVLVEVTTKWSADAKRMSDTTWLDASLAAWVKANAVAIRVDFDADPRWAFAHRVSAFPTVLLMSPDGAELARLEGFAEPQALQAAFEKGAAEYRAHPPATRPATAPARESPMARHYAARQLAEAGDREGALKGYLWCLDEGPRVDPNYAAIRNSLLIRQIVELGADYPPALEALRQRRDAALVRIRANQERPGDVVTFASINRQLGEEDRTLAVYDELLTQPTPSTTLSQLARFSFGPLLVQRRYRDIELGNPDLLAQGMRQFSYYDESAALAGRYPAEERDELQRLRLDSLRDSVCQYYEVLCGIGAPADAAKLAEKLLAIDASDETYLSLARHALRSERPRHEDVTYARQADEMRGGKDATALGVLAELMAMTGDVDPAVTMLQKRMPAFEGEAAKELDRVLHRMPRYARLPVMLEGAPPPSSAPGKQE